VRQANLLKHPGVVRILEPLEETRNQFILVTEEVVGSLDSWLAGRCRLQTEVRRPQQSAPHSMCDGHAHRADVCLWAC
jgi:hypothetical protein